jgi:hypothetical protein
MFAVAIIVVLYFLTVVCALGTEPGTPRTTNSIKEWRRARQCLPHRITNMTDHWLRHIRDLPHRLLADAVVMEQLHTSLDSGAPMCIAIREALSRITNFHRHSIKQREAVGPEQARDIAREGSGWYETLRLLEDVSSVVVVQCQQKTASMAPDKLHSRTIAHCMADYRYNAFISIVVDNLDS